MKLLCVGDIHCKASNLPAFRELMRRVRLLALSQHVDAVWLSGDVFDRHAEVHVACVEAAQSAVTSLAEVCPVWASVGNHDCATNAEPIGSPHALMVLRGIQGLTIIDKGTQIGSVVLAPYRPPGELISHLDDVVPGWRACRVVMCHQEMRGVKVGPIASERGDNWDATLPLAVCGHIHDRQWLAPNVYYVGTPMNHTFGETLDKTVSILNLEDMSIQEISLGLPRKLTIDVSVDSILDLKLPDEDQARVRVSGPSASLLGAKKDKKVAKLLSSAVQVLWIPTDDEVLAHATRQSYDQELLSLLAAEDQTVTSVFREIFG